MKIIFNSPFYHWFYLQPHCAIIRDDLCCSDLDAQFYLILGPAASSLPVVSVLEGSGEESQERKEVIQGVHSQKWI